MANRWYWPGVALSVLACSAHAGTNIGFVRLNGAGGDYLYTAHRIARGDTVYFQFPRADRAACCERVAAASAKPAAGDADATDFHSERELFRYRLVRAVKGDGLPFVGIAVIGRRLAVAQQNAHIRVTEGGEVATVSMCTSSEGVHVVSRAETRVEAHLYLAEDYEIENPTCGANP